MQPVDPATVLAPPGERSPTSRPAPVWLRLPVFQPRATNILLGILVVVWLLEEASGGSQNDQVLRDLGEKANDLIVKGQYWRLITAMFLHAGFLHLAFNGYGIYLFGQQVERFYGWGRFVAMYFVSGLAGSIASFAFSPYPSVGASGALFGLVGVVSAYFWLHRRLLGAFGRTWLWNAITIAGLNLVIDLSQASRIDNYAHIGGFISGIVAGLLLAPRYRPGRALAPDERLLEDATPVWAPPAIVIALFGVELLLFAVALLLQRASS